MPANAPSHPPLYRTLFREALSTAWHHPRLWFLGFFAALLQTGGMYDVLIRSSNSLGSQAIDQLAGSSGALSQGLFAWAMQPMAQIGQTIGLIGTVGRVQGLIFVAILLLIIGGMSVIAQGGLVYGLGIRLRGSVPSLSACLAVGGRFFWKTATINVVTLGLLWFFRILVVLPFATPLDQTSAWTIIASIASYIVFILAAIVLTSIHMLALNSLILQKYSVSESLARAFSQLKRAWLIILELGLGFFVLGIGLFLGLGLVYVIAGVPLVVLTLSAALLNSAFAATILNVFFFGGAFVAFLLLGSFATTVQYSAWQGLSMRLAQGTALARLHRWIRPNARA